MNKVLSEISGVAYVMDDVLVYVWTTQEEKKNAFLQNFNLYYCLNGNW